MIVEVIRASKSTGPEDKGVLRAWLKDLKLCPQREHLTCFTG